MAEKATYGITALRYAGSQIVEAMMGLIDATSARWDLRPAPTRVNEVVDRLVEGDTVISLFPDDEGGLQPGPEVKVDVLPGGTETLSLAEGTPAAGSTTCRGSDGPTGPSRRSRASSPLPCIVPFPNPRHSREGGNSGHPRSCSLRE